MIVIFREAFPVVQYQMHEDMLLYIHLDDGSVSNECTIAGRVGQGPCTHGKINIP